MTDDDYFSVGVILGLPLGVAAGLLAAGVAELALLIVLCTVVGVGVLRQQAEESRRDPLRERPSPEPGPEPPPGERPFR